MVSSMNIEIKTNVSKIITNMSRRLNNMEKGSAEAVRTTSELGKYYAIQIMPIDTGATARATKWVRGKTPNTATVIFGDGHPETRNRIKESSKIHNFTKYMNESQGAARTHFTSGEPHFIEKTKVVMRDAFNKKMRYVVNAFVNGK
jgi:hypothetical protein